MIRIPLLVAIALFLYGGAAKPNSSWNEVEEDRYQETLESRELSGKMSLGMEEVEPPEDMAVTDEDIHPSMAIWKAVQWSRAKKHLTPEVEGDKPNRPAPVPDARGNSAGQQGLFRNDPGQPHPGYALDQRSPKVPGQVDYTRPEEDRDELYHGREPGEHLHPQPRVQVQPAPLSHMTYTQPEEDRDHLYHH